MTSFSFVTSDGDGLDLVKPPTKKLLGPDGSPLPRAPGNRKQLRQVWPRRAAGAIVCMSIRFMDGHYIPPELWQAWKPPKGWRKSGFYIQGNRDFETKKFKFVFPYARVYCYDPNAISAEDLTLINATLRLMQRPYP